MIREWLETYHPKNAGEAEQVLREIMQEIALAGLARSGFFEKAAFYGGTALRIFHGLKRYSEDLDFSLLQPDTGFPLEHYLEGIRTEFAALGVTVSIEEKVKTKQSQVDSAFLKPDTTWKELVIREILPQESVKVQHDLKIKIELDTKPPGGFETENLLLLKPYSFYTKCYCLPDLFAGKMHALLFRKWGTRVKGRDWFDLEWYISKGVELNLDHFLQRATDSGDWNSKSIAPDQLLNELQKKIDSVNFNRIREDIIRFIEDEKQIAHWSPAYFKDLIQKLRFKGWLRVTKYWSDPVMLEYGKNLRIFSAKSGLRARVYNARGVQHIKQIAGLDHTLEFTADEIAQINPQMLGVISESGDSFIRFEQT